MPIDKEKETLPLLVLHKEHVMRWPSEAFDALLARLENPDLRPNPAMQKALCRNTIWQRRKS